VGGNDPAGIARNTFKKINQRKVKGKLDNLIYALHKEQCEGNTGIGHTRWATHGEPSDKKAHPHSSTSVSLVHKGIIEKAAELKKLKEGKEYHFESDTDSEVITALLTFNLKEGLSHLERVQKTMPTLEGSYALAIIFRDSEDTMNGAKNGSPLVAGTKGVGNTIGTDSMA
jgi:Glucosamine 6-phosphate synthetase, contains amidotransferase and phosphosugar isomerase domains